MIQFNDEEGDRDISQLWMVPYADLMSILVIFFLALFGFAYMRRHGGYERAVAHLQKEMRGGDEALRKAEQKAREAEVAEKLEAELAGLPKDQVAVRLDSQRLKVTLGGGVLFEEGSAALKPAAEDVLSKIAGSLRALPYPVIVEGHTDDVPPGRKLRYASNWELSAARAFSVIEFFTEKGLPAERFSALGRAANRPVAPNDAPEGRARNRRIEIYLQRQA